MSAEIDADREHLLAGIALVEHLADLLWSVDTLRRTDGGRDDRPPNPNLVLDVVAGAAAVAALARDELQRVRR